MMNFEDTNSIVSILVIVYNTAISTRSCHHTPNGNDAGMKVASLICSVNNLIFFSILVIVLCYLQTKESSASQQHSCPHLQITQPHMRNTSLWSDFVINNADFINVDETEAIQELVAQTTELKAIFNHFKELYVSYSYEVLIINGY